MKKEGNKLVKRITESIQQHDVITGLMKEIPIKKGVKKPQKPSKKKN